MNWNNLDLNSPYESNAPILDSYNIEMLLLEISCNLKVINEKTVREQAMLSLKSKYDTAIEILEANLSNITNKAIEYRNEDFN